ncbi:MAG: hypothetical protein IJE97_17615 [Thermoguttaceae bacterium]|nr:hypothetical protein [Thermoguttaceae bacterium]
MDKMGEIGRVGARRKSQNERETNEKRTQNGRKTNEKRTQNGRKTNEKRTQNERETTSTLNDATRKRKIAAASFAFVFSS